MYKSVQSVQLPCSVSCDNYHPSDLDNFLPWACAEMGAGLKPVIVTRIELSKWPYLIQINIKYTKNKGILFSLKRQLPYYE